MTAVVEVTRGMNGAFDPRIIRLGLKVGDNDVEYFEDLDIRVQGMKTAGPTQNQATIRISNLTRDQRNYILTKSSPLALAGQNGKIFVPTFLTLDVGRRSYGTFRLFEGNVYTSNVTPPPDLSIVLVSLMNSELMSLLAANSQNGMTDLKTIAQSIATQCKLQLNFNVKVNKQVANYSFTGSVLRQIDKLQMIGDVIAYIDNGVLYVEDTYFLDKSKNFNLSMATGMVGVPQATQGGVVAQMLIQPGVRAGGSITVNSQINPSVNGDNYKIWQVGFDIANRDDPFWYTILCNNNALVAGPN